MADKKIKYKEGDLIDESTLKELGTKGGPESSSAVMQDEKGQYIVNLQDDEYFFPNKGRTNARDTLRAEGGTFTDDITYTPENVNEDNTFALKSLLKNKEAEARDRKPKTQ